MVIERDESEFARLSQLGDILGLTPFDVSGVHQGLAEQAFRNQAQALLADGTLTAEKSESLTKMREQMGLPQEAANKIIKGIQNQRLIGRFVFGFLGGGGVHPLNKKSAAVVCRCMFFMLYDAFIE